jgi:bacteriocin biosynthesis cyclodehydratase domain-containing protein
MLLRLDPSIPRVWRSPSSLQFGIQSTRVVLTELTLAQERLIQALESGISREGLVMLGARDGVRAKDVDVMLARLTPVLETQPAATEQSHVIVVGRGPTAESVTQVLRGSGVRVTLVASADAGMPDHVDVAVAIGHFVLDPRLHGLWLRRDIPHLPVVFGDTHVRMGPFVEPGASACLHCIELHAVDADPAWPAIASQLLGRRASTETPLLAIETAGRVARAVIDRLDGASSITNSIRLSASTGRLSRETVLPHPECGCLVLQGNGSARADQSDSAPELPTKERRSAARA